MRVVVETGAPLGRQKLLTKLVECLYERNDVSLTRGRFRVRGEIVDIIPAYLETGLRIEFFGDDVESISELDPVTGTTGRRLDRVEIYPANQYVTTGDKRDNAIAAIRAELAERVGQFESKGLLLEAQRIRMRTEYDLEMLQEIGFCNGIENYSRLIAGRPPGSRPFCLLDFFPKDFLLIVDESHVTIPQVGAMFEGDRSRKTTLVDHGFRLPSALDNRPLKFAEFEQIVGQALYVSATPAAWELQRSPVVAEQVIRPTGLLDPEITLKPTKGQVEDLIAEIQRATGAGERVLVTTLTKRLAEDITTHLREHKVRVEYLHSDIDAIERVEILRRLRRGHFDVLVGINLLREGLDLPEVALVAILDADKEGFLRSETSLIQTAGRAARHERGRVVFYADVRTESIERTIAVTADRRRRQIEFNTANGITPTGVRRGEQASLHDEEARAGEERALAVREGMGEDEVKAVIAELEAEMLDASSKLEFERAALVRDQINLLKSGDFKTAARSEGGATRRAGPRKAAHRGAKWRPGGKR
jgi:excinuclease ABC subunit B